MADPTRNDNHGSRDSFSWDQVKETRGREYYLGNSVKAPVGRWQEGRDIFWYTKARTRIDSAILDALKAQEAQAMAEALGTTVAVENPPLPTMEQLPPTPASSRRSARRKHRSRSPTGSPRSKRTHGRHHQSQRVRHTDSTRMSSTTRKRSSSRTQHHPRSPACHRSRTTRHSHHSRSPYRHHRSRQSRNLR